MASCVRYVSTLLLGMGVVLSCKNSEECERKRMEVARIWSRVKEGAVRRRNAEDGTVKSDAFQKKWSRIENQAELVSSSFETEQVTWNGAAKGQKQLQEDTSEMAGSNDPGTQNFVRLLEEANRKVAEFEKACR